MLKPRPFWEHFKGDIEGIGLSSQTSHVYTFPKKRNRAEYRCVEILPKSETTHSIKLSYFVGVDWIIENEQAIYVEPKLNTKLNDDGSPKNDVNFKEIQQTDYLRMLFSALRHPEIGAYTDELFEIKWDAPQIEITQQQDLLTPLMVVQFLKVLQSIVRKGLKKSYYKVEYNLYGKVKGKILVGHTIKQNLLKNKPLNTYCCYDEFGVNGLDNRLLKKALVFVQRYLPSLRIPQSEKYTTDVFNYVLPAFEFVTEEISINDIKHSKTNAFYKEYKEGIRLARLILKRFGYNITNTQQSVIKTPPFWIDMSKMFELYVLGLLKDRFGNDLIYHFSTYGNELDFLLKSEDYKMVIDAKYKTKYDTSKDHTDIRQVSGYARLDRVYNHLNKPKNELIDCLIIYPDQENGNNNLLDIKLNAPENLIKGYNSIFKVPVKLPTLQIIKTNELSCLTTI